MAVRAKNSTLYNMVLEGFPNNVITQGQQYNFGEKLTVILYADINHHVGTPKQKQKKAGLTTISVDAQSSILLLYGTVCDDDTYTHIYIYHTLSSTRVLSRKDHQRNRRNRK